MHSNTDRAGITEIHEKTNKLYRLIDYIKRSLCGVACRCRIAAKGKRITKTTKTPEGNPIYIF